MNRFLLHVLVVLVASSCATQSAEKKSASKPLNVVYIMADDLAYQAISAYGSEISKLAPTPNIDRIAKGQQLVNVLTDISTI